MKTVLWSTVHLLILRLFKIRCRTGSGKKRIARSQPFCHNVRSLARYTSLYQISSKFLKDNKLSATNLDGQTGRHVQIVGGSDSQSSGIIKSGWKLTLPPYTCKVQKKQQFIKFLYRSRPYILLQVFVS